MSNPYPKLIIGNQGVFSLKSPFDKDLVTRDDSVKIQYTIAALNSIEALEMSGLNVFDNIYKLKGLSKETYDNDKIAKVAIVTLTSIGQKTIYVPQSYVLGEPIYDNVPYYEPVIHATLGLIPNELNLLFLQQQIAGLITDVVGVAESKIVVKVSGLPINGAVSLDNHNDMETRRKNNIKTRPTDRARALALEEENKALKKEIVKLQKLCLKHNLITT